MEEHDGTEQTSQLDAIQMARTNTHAQCMGKWCLIQLDMANDPETEAINNDEEYVILPNESRNPARVAGGRRISSSRSRNKKHRSVTAILDDPADDDTDDSDTEQAPQKIQIMDFFKKKGHKPGPEQLGQPNVKEKEKIIDMSKDHMDV